MFRYSLGLICLIASGAVTNVHVVERTDFADGRSFGSAGPYEVIRAKAFFAVDPNLAANKNIVDLHLAPKNEDGQVEWTADWYVLKPRDSSKGNGTVLFEVSNRGKRGIENMFNREHDNLLLERGFTLVWCGWQWDIPEAFKEGLRYDAPIATDNGKVIRGLVRAEHTPMKTGTIMPLSDRDHIAYPVVSGGKLTVRSSDAGQPQEIDASRWKVVNNGRAIEMASGFVPGKIYQFVYTAENPRIAGLGMASVRDTVSFFKYGGGGMMLVDQPRFIKRSIGFGMSQTGRFLRKFLYDGFNADEKGRQVFDGVWAHVAGAGRGSFNHRFAQASRDGQPFLNPFYPSDLPPFTDDGLLKKAKAANVLPKIFYTDSAYEYWGRASALTQVNDNGTADVAYDANTQKYMLAGTQHAPGTFPPVKNPELQYLPNSNDLRFTMRALLVGMNAWITTGKEPPAAAHPTIAAGTLVSPDKVKFPIAGYRTPARPYVVYKMNFGPEFTATGIITKEPPEIGAAFPVLVPQIGPDGNDVAGIRLPQIAVPLAAYSGWNYRTATVGAEGEIHAMNGSTIPFSKEKIAQLYKGKDDYISKTLAAARAQVKQGYLLEEDVLEIVERAGEQWEKMGTLK